MKAVVLSANLHAFCFFRFFFAEEKNKQNLMISAIRMLWYSFLFRTAVLHSVSRRDQWKSNTRVCDECYQIKSVEKSHAFFLVIITLYIHKLHSFRHWYFPITLWTVVFLTDSISLFIFHRFNCVRVITTTLFSVFSLCLQIVNLKCRI